MAYNPGELKSLREEECRDVAKVIRLIEGSGKSYKDLKLIEDLGINPTQHSTVDIPYQFISEGERESEVLEIPSIILIGDDSIVVAITKDDMRSLAKIYLKLRSIVDITEGTAPIEGIPNAVLKSFIDQQNYIIGSAVVSNTSKAKSITKIVGKEYVMPIRKDSWLTTITFALHIDLIKLPQYSARVSRVPVGTKDMGDKISTLIVGFYASCFMYLLNDSGRALHEFELILIEVASKDPSLVAYPMIDKEYHHKKPNNEEGEFIRRAGVLFVMSSVKPSITSESNADQGPAWEQKRHQALLANMGHPTVLGSITGLNADIVVLNQFWQSHNNLKHAVLPWLLFTANFVRSEFLLALRSQMLMIARDHDSLMFSLCLQFAEGAETMAHTIKNVITEVRKIIGVKNELEESLRRYCNNKGFNKEIPIGYYSCVMPRSTSLDLTNYPCLTYCVNKDLASRATSTWKNVILHKVQPTCQTATLDSALAVPLPKTHNVTDTMSADDISLLKSLGADTDKLVQKPPPTVTYGPNDIAALLQALRIQAP